MEFHYEEAPDQKVLSDRQLTNKYHRVLYQQYKREAKSTIFLCSKTFCGSMACINLNGKVVNFGSFFILTKTLREELSP